MSWHGVPQHALRCEGRALALSSARVIHVVILQLVIHLVWCVQRLALVATTCGLPCHQWFSNGADRCAERQFAHKLRLLLHFSAPCSWISLSAAALGEIGGSCCAYRIVQHVMHHWVDGVVKL